MPSFAFCLMEFNFELSLEEFILGLILRFLFIKTSDNHRLVYFILYKKLPRYKVDWMKLYVCMVFSY